MYKVTDSDSQHAGFSSMRTIATLSEVTRNLRQQEFAVNNRLAH